MTFDFKFKNIILVIVFMFLPFLSIASDSNVIDEVLDRANNKQVVRQSMGVDDSVYNSMSTALEKAQDRANIIERKNSEFRSSGAHNDNGTKYSCSVSCTGSWWASGSNIKIEVVGESEDRAKDIAAKKADPLCRSQKASDGVFKDIRLSAGSAKCRKIM